MAQALNRGIHIALREKPQHPFAAFSAPDHLGRKAVPETDPLANRHLAAWPNQRAPLLCIIGNGFQQKHFNIAAPSLARTMQSRRKHPRIIQYQAIARPEKRRKFPELTVLK